MTNTNKLQMVEAGLELETQLSKQIWNDMWGDSIGKGFFHLEVNFRCPTYIVDEKNLLRVSDSLYGPLHLMLLEAKHVLGITEKIELYVQASDAKQAFSKMWYDDSEHKYIILTSGLVECLSDDELRFVIGHELGHTIHDHYKLKVLSDYLYGKKDDKPVVLAKQYRLMKQLSELFCDRCGYIAAGCLEPCISALFRGEYNADVCRFGNDIDAYVSKAESRVSAIQECPIHYNDSLHPDTALRVVLLKLFDECENEETLKTTTLSLVEPLRSIAVECFIDNEIKHIVAFARMIEKSAGLTAGSYRQPLSLYMRRYLVLADDCYDSIKPDELEEVFYDMVRLHKDYSCFNFGKVLDAMLNMVFMNRTPSEAEISFIKHVAVDEIGTSETDFGRSLASALWNRYHIKYML